MMCTSCGCKLDANESGDITKMREKKKFMPQVCTECLESWSEEWDEDRVDVIGQNGNDGLHYE